MRSLFTGIMLLIYWYPVRSIKIKQSVDAFCPDEKTILVRLEARVPLEFQKVVRYAGALIAVDRYTKSQDHEALAMLGLSQLSRERKGVVAFGAVETASETSASTLTEVSSQKWNFGTGEINDLKVDKAIDSNKRHVWYISGGYQGIRQTQFDLLKRKISSLVSIVETEENARACGLSCNLNVFIQPCEDGCNVLETQATPTNVRQASFYTESEKSSLENSSLEGSFRQGFLATRGTANFTSEQKEKRTAFNQYACSSILNDISKAIASKKGPTKKGSNKKERKDHPMSGEPSLNSLERLNSLDSPERSRNSLEENEMSETQPQGSGSKSGSRSEEDENCSCEGAGGENAKVKESITLAVGGAFVGGTFSVLVSELSKSSKWRSLNKESSEDVHENHDENFSVDYDQEESPVDAETGWEVTEKITDAFAETEPIERQAFIMTL